MSRWKVTKCRDCEAEIIWAITKNEKRMPVNAEPSENGNVELLGEGGVPRAVVHAQAPMNVPVLHVSHFVTCPNAEGRRR